MLNYKKKKKKCSPSTLVIYHNIVFSNHLKYFG